MLRPFMTAIGFGTALVAAVALTAPAQAKVARCVVDSAGGTYSGPCQYNVARGGTFTVVPLRGRYFAAETRSLTVYVTRPGFAEVRGLTDGGINSRWGRATRSYNDRACWIGRDFSVCVY